VKPAYVKGYAARIWKKIIASMPDGLYTACDASLLATYCIAVALHKEAVETLETESGVVSGANGAPYQNPWVSIQNKQAQLMATIGSRLGLDPATRSSIKTPGIKESSKFADLITMPGGKK
jgi:P27 family predicted phage terminase small subunit